MYSESIYVYVYVSICIYMYMYVDVYVHVYVIRICIRILQTIFSHACDYTPLAHMCARFAHMQQYLPNACCIRAAATDLVRDGFVF